MPGIRNGVRAVIIRDDHILLLRKEYENGASRYVLPGGSQDEGETLEVALQRECTEEIGTAVSLLGLIYLADFFKPRDSQPVIYRQHVEYLFRCEVPVSYEAKCGHRPDKHQVDVTWVPLRQLNEVNLYPGELARLLMQDELNAHSIYLGEISI